MASDLGALVTRALGEHEATAPAEDRVLDAALVEVGAHGTRGATMDAIAKRAGVARITAFRRFGSKDALLERLAVRELRRFLSEVEATLEPIEDPGERIAEAFVACVNLSTRHPLVARLARHEPGPTFALLGRGKPSPLDMGRTFVAAHLRAGPDPPAEPDAVADVLVRLALTYVLLPGRIVDVRDEAAARRFALALLAPIAGGP